MFFCINLDKTKDYIISVSGGIDSMVLLDFLYHQNYKLKVVHFNHSVRKDSIKDKNLVYDYCLKKNIDFHYFKLNLNYEEGNFQNKARILRLEKLKQVALQYKTKYLLTAHHLDDLSETIFLKILRGSSLLGYSGMQDSCLYEDFILLKPFLYTEKKKIIEYANINKILFIEDYTNKQNIYFRNQIRNQVIPFFKESRNFLKNIKKFHFQIKEIYSFIRQNTLFFLQKQKFSHMLDLKYFLSLNIAIQKDIIVFLLENKKINLNFVFINNIIKCLNNKNKASIILNLEPNYVLIKEYRYFYIEKKTKILKNKNLDKKNPILHLSPNKFLISFCCIIEKIYYDVKNFYPPFILRKRASGDILKFNFGTQKLKKFFINKKIVYQERDNIYIVSDKMNNIIWIPKLYINKTLGKDNFIYLGIQYN